MERKHYLYLIAETYFETKNPVASEPAEPMFDLQMSLFRQILIRKQKVAEREEFITKDEFFLQCELALDELKEYVLSKPFLVLQNLHQNIKTIQTYFFERDGSIHDLPDVVIEENTKRIQNKIDNFDEKSFLVDLSKLNPAIVGKLCSYDIEFLEDIIKNFEINTNEPQQPEPEPLDLSDSKITDKIAYLYESGIIDFLHKKDGKPHTVNSIASLLSGITGIKPNTIQSAINPFINTNSTSKGTPAQSTLNKAKSKIIDLGF